MATPNNRTKKKKKTGADNVLFGDIMSSNIFKRHKFTITLLCVLILFYIAFKYECQTQMETISKLETELAIVKTESIREQSTYRSRTRETMMQQLVDSMHLNLRVPDQPPYRISY